jgi:hypothetical protein
VDIKASLIDAAKYDHDPFHYSFSEVQEMAAIANRKCNWRTIGYIPEIKRCCAS